MTEELMSVVTAAGVVGGLSGALAVVLVLADALLADTGPCTITVNREKELTVEGGATLLAGLTSRDLFIPSACGGRGSCGLCKCKVLEGGGPLLPTEEPHLTPQDLAAGLRLACQIKLRGDVAIEIPEELFAIRRYTGVCEALADLTYDTKLVRIRLTEPAAIDFKAGQYIQLEAPAYGDNPEPVYRAYSMASAPSRHDAIELVVRRVPGGICTTWVHTILREGDTVYFNGPYGDFLLRDTGRDILFVAGGSGLAPVRSILYDMVEKGVRRSAVFYFGAVAGRDLYCVEEMQAFADKLPGFAFVPALSAPAAGDDWSGETGLITEVIDRLETDPAEKEIYACGSPGMIDAVKKVLKAKGVPEERIYYDKFV
jgi:Na+-transporting NADH:ubiquinone oxidoreductase subunit F